MSQCIDFLLYIVPNKVIRAIKISYHTFKKASENKFLILFNTERLQKSEEKILCESKKHFKEFIKSVGLLLITESQLNGKEGVVIFLYIIMHTNNIKCSLMSHFVEF